MYKNIRLFLVTMILLSACSLPDSLASDDNSDFTLIEEAAKEFLSRELGTSVKDIKLVSIEAVDWPDSCLGVKDPKSACMTVVTPGYELIFEADGVTYEIHSDKTGKNIVLASTIEEPDIVKVVKNHMVTEYGIKLDLIHTVFYEAVEWSDSCLGVHEPDTKCLQVITPGYRVILDAEGKIYTFHTNEKGSQIILAPEIEEPPVVDLVKEYMAKELGIKPDVIKTVSFEAVDWPDGCLGVAERNVACIQVVTPGYRIILEHNGTIYAFRTDESGSLIKHDPNAELNSNNS
jgi:hemin uptake protein HemP